MAQWWWLAYNQLSFVHNFERKPSATSLWEESWSLAFPTKRKRVEDNNDGKQIQETARRLAASDMDINFLSAFGNEYKRGSADRDYTVLAGKAAESMLDTFTSVGQNGGKSKQVTKQTI